MKGLIRRRGDAWELRVYLGTDPVTNKQRYASRTVRTGKREAQRVLNEMISEAERGLSVRTSATVGDLLERWFDFAARDFSPKTVKGTRGFIDRNLLPALGSVPLSKLRASDLDRFYRKLSVDGGSRSGPPRARDGPPDSRHLAPRSWPGTEVGLDRHQPGSRHDAASIAATGHQSTVERRSRARAATSR